MSANVPLAKAAHLAGAIVREQGSTLTYCEASLGWQVCPSHWGCMCACVGWGAGGTILNSFSNLIWPSQAFQWGSIVLEGACFNHYTHTITRNLVFLNWAEWPLMRNCSQVHLHRAQRTWLHLDRCSCKIERPWCLPYYLAPDLNPHPSSVASGNLQLIPPNPSGQGYWKLFDCDPRKKWIN